MSANADVAAVARVLADPARVRLLLALGQDRQLAAGELAALAGWSRPASCAFTSAASTATSRSPIQRSPGS